MFTTRSRKNLLEKINKLSPTEHEEIFKIMQQHSKPFTQNKNGIFFNFTKVEDHIVKQLEDFVEFCLKNKVELDKYDKILHDCKLNQNYDCISQPFNASTIPPKSESLDVFLAKGVAENINNSADDWLLVLNETKQTEKATIFMNILQDNIDKIHKKKQNTKYINAKKKYSKRGTEKKIDWQNQHKNDLNHETYLIKS